MSETAEPVVKKQNKTSLVRQVLSEIGALCENPPENWKKQVDEALALRQFTMHPVSIYQIRQKEIQKLTGVKKVRKQRKVKNTEAPSVKSDVSVADLQLLCKFASQYGGFDKIEKAISTIKSFSV
jgi:hypothetical protein